MQVTEMLSALLPTKPFLGPLLFTSSVYLFRYVVIAGIAFVGWYAARRGNARWGKLQAAAPTGAQVRREIFNSLTAFVVFGMVNGVIIGYGILPHTQAYRHITDYGWLYFWLSIPLMMLVHDFYFYWMHRLMHHRALFRHVHRVHHLSTNPTPMTSFSFHPLESVIEALGVTFVVFVMPTHFFALMIFETISTIINVYGHLGYELYPAGWSRHWFGRWINTSVAHNTHHATARHNYGLYFLFWDRLCGTLDPKYDARYAQAKRGGEVAELQAGKMAA